MKPYTTSAQKTIRLSTKATLRQLQQSISEAEKTTFTNTKRPNIKEAKMNDGSVMVIASFEKEDGRTIAMIDHKKVPAQQPREALQKKWRDLLDKLFA